MWNFGASSYQIFPPANALMVSYLSLFSLFLIFLFFFQPQGIVGYFLFFNIKFSLSVYDSFTHLLFYPQFLNFYSLKKIKKTIWGATFLYSSCASTYLQIHRKDW